MKNIMNELYQCVIDGQKNEVENLVNQAIISGISPVTILNQGMIAAMSEVGRRFEAGDFYVPEMLIAARAMQSGLALLRPYLQEGDVKPAGLVVIGTVKGDLHDIGKNLVAMMWEGAGFEIVDLGPDVPAEKFIEAVRTHKADILAMSALLTTTMANMKGIIQLIQTSDLDKKVHVIIGGAPVTEKYANSIGADGYGPDASRAVSLVKALVSAK